MDTAHTTVLFRRAGISAGHRVLDLGCGPGDVSFLAAEIVGPGGHVVGVDRSPDAVEAARDRARRVGQLNVTFKVGDAADLAIAGQFDVIVGRLMLGGLPDPVKVLRQLQKYLRPQGLIVLEEGELGVQLVSLLHQAGYRMEGISVAPRKGAGVSLARLVGIWGRIAGGFSS